MTSGRLPMRPPSAPVKGETMSGRSVQGSISTPARMAESPCTCVRYSITMKKAPNIVKWRAKPAPFAAEKPGLRKSARGSIGGDGAALLEHEQSRGGPRPRRRLRAWRARSSRLVAARSRPDDAEQAGAGEREARQVERHLRAAALGQATGRQDGGGHAHRHVDPEDPVPVEGLDDEAPRAAVRAPRPGPRWTTTARAPRWSRLGAGTRPKAASA